MTWSAHIQFQLGQLDLDCTLEGDHVPLALVGPNGAGKSSLFRLLTGGLTPDAGHFAVDGNVLFDSQLGVDLPPEARGVGYVPQGHGLFPHLRVIDNVAFGLQAAGHGKARRRAVALEMLQGLGCAELAGRRPATLSGGEAQRVALARALVVSPRILLLDEPLAALDTSSRRATRRVLAEQLRALGCPAVVITHDLRDVIALDARVAVLENGHVVQEGRPRELKAAPATEFVAEFFGPMTS